MIIEVERTGGFAGMHLSARIDTEKLPEEQALPKKREQESC